MYKNLLVHIPTERSPRAVVDGSVSLASSCNAHLLAVATGYVHLSDVAFVSDGGAAIGALFEVEQERAEERTKAALEIFEIEAKNAAIPYKSIAMNGTFDDASRLLSGHARLSDLLVISQPEPGPRTFDNVIAQDMLFQAGGPILVMPFTFHGALRLDHVGICWDGSRLAARAVRDAMPLLKKARKLSIIAINDPASGDATASKLAERLKNHRLDADVISVRSDRAQIHPTILSIVADEGVDLIVMGGYGHSRFKETILGGVTREMFNSMTVPTMMSH